MHSLFMHRLFIHSLVTHSPVDFMSDDKNQRQLQLNNAIGSTAIVNIKKPSNKSLFEGFLMLGMTEY